MKCRESRGPLILDQCYHQAHYYHYHIIIFPFIFFFFIIIFPFIILSYSCPMEDACMVPNANILSFIQQYDILEMLIDFMCLANQSPWFLVWKWFTCRICTLYLYRCYRTIWPPHPQKKWQSVWCRSHVTYQISMRIKEPTNIENHY